MSDSENATTLPNVNGKPTRRTVLKAGAALVSTTATAVPAMAAPHPAHPDAALIQAWNDCVVGHRELDMAPCTDEAQDPIWERIDAAAKNIQDIPAYTHAGYAVKVRYTLHMYLEFIGLSEPDIVGEWPIPKIRPDRHDFVSLTLWSMAHHAESMGGAA